MNRQQKIAWFSIVILTFSFLISVAVVIWMAFLKAGLIALSGFGFLALCLLHLLGPVIFRKKHQPGQVFFDERDSEIARRAVSYGDSASNALILLVFVCLLFIFGFDGVVRVHVLGVTIAGAYYASKLTESLTTLILYGRGKSHGED